jgi:2-keto-4-pentenoate hydratase/2-oxohepta-3-ene-1,7-dioic acid hydratase in catechol pathway
MGGFIKDGVRPPADAVPWLVPKASAWTQGDNAEIAVPRFIEKVWAEVEIAVVIGRAIHSASIEDARAAILGYTCFNDASAPQFLAARDWWRMKSIDTFASLGPWIRTDLSELEISNGLRLSVRVNGELKGEGNTKDFRFAPSEVVRFASDYTTLYPGDVISLGCPKTVEVGPGDEVELAVESVGVLRNRIVDAD